MYQTLQSQRETQLGGSVWHGTTAKKQAAEDQGKFIFMYVYCDSKEENRTVSRTKRNLGNTHRDSSLWQINWYHSWKTMWSFDTTRNVDMVVTKVFTLFPTTPTDLVLITITPVVTVTSKVSLNDSLLLGYGTMSLGNGIPTFRGNIVSQDTTLPRNVGIRLPSDVVEIHCLETSGSDYPVT